MMESEAWSNVSGRVAFSEAQLEKFADKLDWEQVSSNSNIFWTESMMEKFKGRISWDRIASNINEECLTVDILEKFKDRWDWDEFSDNGTVTLEILDAFADKVNWRKLISNYRFIREVDCEVIMKRFEDKIPAVEFKNSNLWNELVERKEKDVLRTLSRM